MDLISENASNHPGRIEPVGFLFGKMTGIFENEINVRDESFVLGGFYSNS